MNLRKLLISGAVTACITMGSTAAASAQNMSYTVKSGDTYWIISQKYGITVDSLLEANNKTANTILYPGQQLIIPQVSQVIHTVRKGETYWTVSKAYGVDFNALLAANNANSGSWLTIGQKIIIPAGSGTAPSTPAAGPYVTYKSYTVKSGDTFTAIANSNGIPVGELIEANGMSLSSVLNVGKVLKIPVHHIPVKNTPGAQYGEKLDWWTEAQYLVPRNAVFEIVDFYSGKSFMARRTGGTNHSDTEPLTMNDTNKMKEIFGGSFTWTRRPVIVKINGRRIAASCTAMPHAGVDSAAGGVYVGWRSDGYGAGINYDFVKGNGADGHIDLHFFNSTRHKDGKMDPQHQAAIKVSSGID